ncbi:hypothetical protein Pla52o_50090 [Novipirellula galeiformis]|uniref:Transmembrane protein n=1 Tax=Novipirellula galeiformis TaxID=2528004 RepID=A0A5C6C3D4_9BACT|nr:hypothetical protein Pla52o_50090 [Novipirellula galeiformis]
MRFTTCTLLTFIAVFACAFASIKHPSTMVIEVLTHLYVLSACTALVAAFHSTGRVQSYSLTYGVFGFGLIQFRSFPQSISMWIWENVTHDGPQTVPIDNGEWYLVQNIVETTTSVVLCLFAASLVAGFQRRASDA